MVKIMETCVGHEGGQLHNSPDLLRPIVGVTVKNILSRKSNCWHPVTLFPSLIYYPSPTFFSRIIFYVTKFRSVLSIILPASLDRSGIQILRFVIAWRTLLENVVKKCHPFIEL
jgi:hypothetical protein